MACSTEWKYVAYDDGTTQLIDRSNDPDELQDESAGHPDVCAEYKQILTNIYGAAPLNG